MMIIQCASLATWTFEGRSWNRNLASDCALLTSHNPYKCIIFHKTNTIANLCKYFLMYHINACNSFTFSKTFTSVCSHNTTHTNVCFEQIHLQTWRITLSCSHKSFHSLCVQAAPKQMYSHIWKNTFLESCWNTVCVSCLRRFPAC